jgi:hypothetical protein
MLEVIGIGSGDMLTSQSPPICIESLEGRVVSVWCSGHAIDFISLSAISAHNSPASRASIPAES